MLGWLLIHLPWWAWAIAILAVWCALAFAVGSLFGWKYARWMIWPAIFIVGLVAVALRERQAGYRQREAEDQKAIERAEEIVDDKRDEVHKLPDDELDKRLDRWDQE